MAIFYPLRLKCVLVCKKCEGANPNDEQHGNDRAEAFSPCGFSLISGAALVAVVVVAAAAKRAHPSLGVSYVAAVLEVASWPFSTPAAETVRSRMQRMQVRQSRRRTTRQ